MYVWNMYEEGWFDGTYEVRGTKYLINRLVTGTLPLPREFFISDPNVTNTYIIIFCCRFISVYRALEKLPLLFIILSESNVR